MITDVLCLGSSEDVKLLSELSAAGTHSIVNTKKFMGGLCISIMFLLYCIRHFITGLFREDEKRFAVSETDPQDSARR